MINQDDTHDIVVQDYLCWYIPSAPITLRLIEKYGIVPRLDNIPVLDIQEMRLDFNFYITNQEEPWDLN